MTGFVFHVPHSATELPGDVRSALCIGKAELARELLLMTDHHTEALFEPAALHVGAITVVFPVSRLVVDPERFEDDAQEPMAGVGMGVIYTCTSDGGPLRAGAPSVDERTSLLERYYRPHHAQLTAAVATVLGAGGRCLLVDCHSFPAKPLSYELDQDQNRPDICLGTDVFHTPSALREATQVAFEREGLTVAINRPFAGALVPLKFYQQDRRVSALMIEVNRRLYMDEVTGARLPGFGQVQAMLARVLGSTGLESQQAHVVQGTSRGPIR